MQRTDRSISDLLTDLVLPGGVLTPFVYRVTDYTDDFVLEAGARSINFLLITAADDAAPPMVGEVPLDKQLSFASEFPGNTLPAFVVSGQAGDDVLIAGLA